MFLKQHFMELEPVAELEEDSGAGEDSPTSSSSPSLSPQPYTVDMWAEVSWHYTAGMDLMHWLLNVAPIGTSACASLYTEWFRKG
jgi:hypothetical protein